MGRPAGPCANLATLTFLAAALAVIMATYLASTSSALSTACYSCASTCCVATVCIYCVDCYPIVAVAFGDGGGESAAVAAAPLSLVGGGVGIFASWRTVLHIFDVPCSVSSSLTLLLLYYNLFARPFTVYLELLL